MTIKPVPDYIDNSSYIVGQDNKQTIAYIKAFPEIKDLGIKTYPHAMVFSETHAVIGVRTATVWMKKDSNYMNSPILYKLSDALLSHVDQSIYALRNIKLEAVQGFCKEIAHIVGTATIPAMKAQAFGVLQKLDGRPELKDFDILINERAYNEAEDFYKKLVPQTS